MNTPTISVYDRQNKYESNFSIIDTMSAVNTTKQLFGGNSQNKNAGGSVTEILNKIYQSKVDAGAPYNDLIEEVNKVRQKFPGWVPMMGLPIMPTVDKVVSTVPQTSPVEASGSRSAEMMTYPSQSKVALETTKSFIKENNKAIIIVVVMIAIVVAGVVIKRKMQK